MNLIQISEQLKEAPDNLLLQEVKAPTGSYPSYLIISELSRRKRLRDGAQPQQAPQTTVADDLSQPAGLAATPQAMQSTAGMDVNGQGDYEEPQEMPQMAGGGLVAFKRGDLIRGQIDEDRYADQSGFQMSVPGAVRSNEILPFGQESRGIIQNIMGGAYAPPTAEQEEETRGLGESRFVKKIPFRREEEANRIAAREQALVGERESNANMALMEAGLGMMGSRSPYGMQGIAEGGLRGLSSFKSGKQDIKKSEAYLDDAKDRYARAQELYDEKKYSAGDREVARADERRRQGLASMESQLRAAAIGRGMAKEDIYTPMELEQKQRELQLARDTYTSAVEAAQLKPNDIRSEINLRNAQAEYYRLGGKNGQGGFKPASMGEINSAYEVAQKRLITENTSLPANQRLQAGSPAYQSRLAEYARQALLRGGKYVDPSTLALTGEQQPGQQPGAPGVIRFDASGQRVQ